MHYIFHQVVVTTEIIFTIIDITIFEVFIYLLLLLSCFNSIEINRKFYIGNTASMLAPPPYVSTNWPSGITGW